MNITVQTSISLVNGEKAGADITVQTSISLVNGEKAGAGLFQPQKKPGPALSKTPTPVMEDAVDVFGPCRSAARDS
jgi:hypothetical protein